MKRCSLAAALLVLASGSAQAVTPEQVFNEMSHEMVECSVYFTGVRRTSLVRALASAHDPKLS